MFIVVDVQNVLILPNFVVVVANSQKSSLDQLLVELIYVIANIYAKKQEYVSSINANEIKAKMLLCSYTFEEKLCWEQWAYFNQKTFHSHRMSRPRNAKYTILVSADQSCPYFMNVSTNISWWIEIKENIKYLSCKKLLGRQITLEKLTFGRY